MSASAYMPLQPRLPASFRSAVMRVMYRLNSSRASLPNAANVYDCIPGRLVVVGPFIYGFTEIREVEILGY